MKIFNRANQEEQARPPASDAPVPQEAAPAGDAAAADGADGEDQADLTAILDANVKEMSDRIAKLATSVESQTDTRQSFEEKIEQMEERMRKLSALTEMISAQYNPFIGDAPEAPEPLPEPHVGLAAPEYETSALPEPPTNGAADARAVDPLASDELPSPEDLLADAVEAENLEPALEPPVSETGAAPEAPASDADAMVDAITIEEPRPAPSDLAEATQSAAMDGEDAGFELWSIRPGFEASLLTLGWADMLLRNAGGRESLVELVQYYHNIGWLGDPARDQLLAYAEGLTTAPDADATDWRARADVHEKSLLYIEKLKALSRRR